MKQNYENDIKKKAQIEEEKKEMQEGLRTQQKTVKK